MNGARWPFSDMTTPFRQGGFFSGRRWRPLPVPRQLGLGCVEIQVRPNRKWWVPRTGAERT
ncbi:MAG: hypothetical protein E5W96_05400 [Mesorhizobium sp.]|nr:MAG: hypothetical protein E5W96_05400 [Mesorhizobium sp.]